MRASPLFLSFYLAAAAVAQDLVRDINSTQQGAASSSPLWPCVLGNQLFFSADDGGHGRELWRTDGTTANTQLVVDLLPGPQGADPRSLTAFAGGLAFVAGGTLYLSNGSTTFVPLGPGLPGMPQYRGAPTVFGTSLYYVADEAAFGTEVWSTDGTVAGTARFVDLAPGSASADPDEFTVGNGLLWFSAKNGSGVRRLFRSNGTAAGTFDPAPAATYGPITRIVAAGGLVFFGCASTGEVWRTDGTAAGTILLNNSFTSGPSNMAAVGNQIVFGAIDAAHGYEPWLSDGTATGTHLLFDVTPGPDSSLATEEFSVLGNQVMFAANDGVHGIEPWISDLTVAGTTMLRDVAPNAANSYPIYCSAVGGAFWFAADDGVTGRELWRSDGTTAGTQRIADLDPSVGSFPAEFTALGSEVFFAADVGAIGREPCMTDGTTAGTRVLRDVANPALGSDPWPFGKLGRRTLVLADDGAHGREPWITDGTPAGTVLLGDLTPGSQSSLPRPLGEWRGKFWFWMVTPGGVTLFTTDGTGSGTTPFRAFPGSSLAFCPFGDRAILVDYQSAQLQQLWVTDGTVPGTQVLNAPFAITSGLAAFRGHCYFAASDAIHGNELWRTDGTAGGTGLFADLDPGPASSAFITFTVIGDRLYFGAGTQEQTNPLRFVVDYEPWVTDGTVAGTVRLADLSPGSGSATVQQFVPFQGDVWFVANLGFASNLLCRTNGTPAGTGVVMPLSGHTNDLVVAGDRLFFQNQGELWSSDGTLSGTALAVDITPGVYASNPEHLVPLGSSRKLVFAASLPFEPRSLWITDGTLAGTTRIDAALSEFSLPWRNGSDVFFAASDAPAGLELRALRLRSQGAAMADAVGEGCRGTAGVPRMRTDAGPLLGSTFTLHLDGALPSAPAFLAFAFGLTPNGDRTPCLVGLDPATAFAIFLPTDAVGHAAANVAIPGATWVLGLEFWSQWLALDPAGGHLGNFSLSPLLDWLIGQ